MLRTNWWLGLLAVGSLAGLNGAAQAQECTDDFDCGAGQKCGWNDSTVEPLPGSDVGGSGAGAAEDIAAPCKPGTSGCSGDPLPPDTRTCVPLDRGECETTADCMDGLECQKYTYSGCDEQPTEPPEPGAEPDSDQDVADPIPEPPPCDAVPVEAKVGYCVLPVTVCTSDDDCLLGLTCVSSKGSGSSGSSGGSTGSGGATDPSQPTGEEDLADPVPVDGGSDDKPSDIPPPESPSTCAYVPQDCDGNAACADGFTCTKVAVASWCDAGPDCQPGSTDCGVPEEPECGTDYAMQCIPALDPCTTDADCDDDWVCSDFGGEEGLEAPESWGTDGKAMKACLPVGIALAANSAGGSGGDIAYPETDDSGKGVDQGTSGTGGDGTAEPHDDSTGGSSSGCSVGFGGGSLQGAWLALGLVGLVSRRRRRAA